MQIYGKNPILEAYRAGRKIHEVFAQKGRKDDFLDTLSEKGIPLRYLPKSVLDKRFGTSHQGLVATVEGYKLFSLDEALDKEGRKLFVMLDSVEDPHNLGAVIRNAEVFGASGVIIPKHRSASITPGVVKASAGSVEYVDIIQVTNLNRAIEKLKSANVWVAGFDVATDKTLSGIHADVDLCLVFGNEHKGLRPLVKKNCDYLVKIPMRGTLNSLNVSVATGIALYDVLRRREG